MRLLLCFLFCFLGWSLAQEDSNLDDALFGTPSAPSQAEESTDTTGPTTNNNSADDALFGEDSFISQVEETDQNAADALLTQDKLTLGGSLSFSTDVTLLLNSNTTDTNDTTGETDDTFSASAGSLSSRLFLDARPSSDLRAFIKGDLDYSEADGAEFTLKEMFVDTDIDKKLFLRAGKQTLNWGVGYFFSPANLLNLERIDPEDPSKELTGPIAVKAQYPIGTNNLTGYLLTDDIPRDASDTRLALAARYEFLWSGYEVTTGARYQLGDNPWALMATIKGGLPLNIRNASLGVFAEAVVEGNLNKRFVVANTAGELSVESGSGVRVSSTFGIRATYLFKNSVNETDLALNLAAQYLFNGKGYRNPKILSDNPQAVAGYLLAGELAISDLLERGQHYAAVNISFSDILQSDVGSNVLWLGNLSDGSGFIDASVRYGGIKYLTPSVTYRHQYGADNTEFALGDRYSLRIELSFGISGTF